jgi:hypothetical protein
MSLLEATELAIIIQAAAVTLWVFVVLFIRR